jgi:hypothetical protein
MPLTVYSLFGSPLGNGVEHILFVRSNEQMSRVATGRVVAAMAAVHTTRDRGFIEQLPCNSMCSPGRIELVVEGPIPMFIG